MLKPIENSINFAYTSFTPLANSYTQTLDISKTIMESGLCRYTLPSQVNGISYLHLFWTFSLKVWLRSTCLQPTRSAIVADIKVPMKRNF